MSEDPISRIPAGQDQLLEEASLWFARMRGPDAEAFRPEFETWLSLGAAHRGAYNRAGEVFAMGRFLAYERASASRRAAPSSAWRGAPRHWALAAGLLLAIGAGTWLLLPRPTKSVFAKDAQTASADANGDSVQNRVSTVGAGRRVVRLPDGSIVTLDAGSLLTTAFDGTSRDLTLRRGHIRFDVAHENRPFVVHAGGGSVTARGTIFDVDLGARGDVTVRLMRGAVDVERPHFAGKGASAVTRLGVGESLSFGLGKADQSDSPAAPGTMATSELSDLSTIREFDRALLSSVLEAANKDSVMQVRLADPSIALLKVSGRFRIDDAEQVAERLAALYDLKLDHVAADKITLRSARAQ